MEIFAQCHNLEGMACELGNTVLCIIYVVLGMTGYTSQTTNFPHFDKMGCPNERLGIQKSGFCQFITIIVIEV